MVIALFCIVVLQRAVAAIQRRNCGASVLGSLVLHNSSIVYWVWGAYGIATIAILLSLLSSIATKGIIPSSGGSCSEEHLQQACVITRADGLGCALGRVSQSLD